MIEELTEYLERKLNKNNILSFYLNVLLVYYAIALVWPANGKSIIYHVNHIKVNNLDKYFVILVNFNFLV